MERSNNSPLVLVLVLLLPGLSSAWVHVCEINGTHVKGYTNTNTTTANNNNNTTTANNNNNNTTITPTNKNYTNDDNTNNNNTTTAIINNNNNYTNDDNNNNTPPFTNNNTNLTLHAGVPFLVHIFDESEPSYFYVISDECDTYIRVGIKRTSRPVTDDSMSDELGRLWARVRYMTDTEGLLHVYFDGGVESHLTGRIRGQSCIPTHYVFRFINLDVGLECAQEVHRKEPHPHPHHPPPRHSTPIIIWVPLGIICMVASLLCKGFCRDQLQMMKGSRESNVNITVQPTPFPEQSPSPPPTPPAASTSNPPSHLQPSTSSPTQVIRSPFDRMKNQFGFSRLHEDQ